MVSYTNRNPNFLLPILVDLIPVLSTREESSNHATCNIPRNTPRIERTSRQIRCLTKLVTPRKCQCIGDRQTQGNNCTSVSISHFNPSQPL